MLRGRDEKKELLLLKNDFFENLAFVSFVDIFAIC